MASSVPDQFLIIVGAPKCGTTTLANWLGRRSDMVLCAQKEPRFFTDFAAIDWQGPVADAFVRTMISDENAYWRAFDNDKGATWGIDASTDYLWCETSAERIKRFAENRRVKLICILRDPVDRALSEYQHTRRDAMQTESFRESLTLEEERRRKFWHPLFYHVRRGSYHADLARYFELFGDDMMMMDFAEIADPERCLARIADFLALPFEAPATADRFNASYVEASPLLSRAINSYKAKKAARTLLGERAAAAMFDKARRLNRKRISFTEDDRARMFEKVAADVAACRDDARIPTGNWASVERLG